MRKTLTLVHSKFPLGGTPYKLEFQFEGVPRAVIEVSHLLSYEEMLAVALAELRMNTQHKKGTD